MCQPRGTFPFLLGTIVATEAETIILSEPGLNSDGSALRNDSGQRNSEFEAPGDARNQQRRLRIRRYRRAVFARTDLSRMTIVHEQFLPNHHDAVTAGGLRW